VLPMTDAAVAALCGSRTRERVRVDAYLGDALVAEGLDVESVSLTWDATRQVQCQGTIKVADPDGTLAPWVLGDVLAPGARLQVTYCCEDGSTLPRALLVVTKAAPESGWRAYRLRDGTARWVPTGGTVTLSVDDTMALVVRDKLQAPLSPATPTCVSEVRRLLTRIVPVVNETSNTVTVASGTVYERERADAVDDLLAHAGLERRTDGAGVVHLIDPKSAGPVWALGAGDGGATVRVDREMSLDDVVNSVVAASSATGQEEIVGRAYLREGVGRWGGPLGNHTRFYASPLISTLIGAEAAARTRLGALTRGRSTLITVECLPHPGLEIWDTVTVPIPDPYGALESVDAVVQTVSLTVDRSGPAVSTLTATAPTDVLTEIMRWRR